MERRHLLPFEMMATLPHCSRNVASRPDPMRRLKSPLDPEQHRQTALATTRSPRLPPSDHTAVESPAPISLRLSALPGGSSAPGYRCPDQSTLEEAAPVGEVMLAPATDLDSAPLLRSSRMAVDATSTVPASDQDRPRGRLLRQQPSLRWTENSANHNLAEGPPRRQSEVPARRSWRDASTHRQTGRMPMPARGPTTERVLTGHTEKYPKSGAAPPGPLCRPFMSVGRRVRSTSAFGQGPPDPVLTPKREDS